MANSLLFWFTVALTIAEPDALPMFIVAAWLALACYRLRPNFWNRSRDGPDMTMGNDHRAAVTLVRPRDTAKSSGR